MKNTNSKTKKIEKEKVVAETLNGRFAMIGLIAAIGAYLTTGQIIPGLVQKTYLQINLKKWRTQTVHIGKTLKEQTEEWL